MRCELGYTCTRGDCQQTHSLEVWPTCSFVRQLSGIVHWASGMHHMCPPAVHDDDSVHAVMVVRDGAPPKLCASSLSKKMCMHTAYSIRYVHMAVHTYICLSRQSVTQMWTDSIQRAGVGPGRDRRRLVTYPSTCNSVRCAQQMLTAQAAASRASITNRPL